MACGCAIITTPVGAIPEMLDINGEAPCGICIAPRDVEQLRVAIEELISDDDKKRVIGQRAKKRVAEQYSINNIWKQLVNIWENC
jgi:glycosyltransferase involved in cell wall biosynthesis